MMHAILLDLIAWIKDILAKDIPYSKTSYDIDSAMFTSLLFGE
jgi:hypothetical protein